MLLLPFATIVDADTGTTAGMLTPDDDWCGAVAAAAPGDRIDLGPGDFHGPCWIRNSVTITGHGSRIVYEG
jgi:hypothetical protein